MSTLDDPGNELFSGTFRDFVLGLVADTATLFQPLQNGGPINRGDELHIRFDNFHCSASFHISDSHLHKLPKEG